jgi:uncharacterized membrane protein YdjX (TVP38/TMEM64 family)
VKRLYSKEDDRISNVTAATSNLWRLILFVIFLALVIVIFRFIDAGEILNSLRGWISTLGAWGPLVYVLIYIAAVIAALPGSVITVAGAALFGSMWGVVLVSIASTCGAGIAFLISRYLARGLILNKLSHNEKFRRLDYLTKKHGAVIVAVTRLVPLFPFNLLNYGFGLTGVTFRTYVFWSWLCMLPGTVLYVVGTDALLSAITSGRIPWPLVSIALIAAVIMAVVAALVRKKIKNSNETGN